MPEAHINGIRLYYEEHGEGAPIACIHGMGSSALLWGDAVDDLARLGRVIVYDRRGCTRSERPEPYERTSVAEHSGDAAALLDQLGCAPAVIIGRSYGGAVGIDLALRYPDRVRALVLLEGDAFEIHPSGLREHVREVAARAGVGGVGEAMISHALGEEVWGSLPDVFRQVFTENGQAILAEAEGGAVEADAGALVTVTQPALLVAATDSPPEFREATAATAAALPNARTSLVEGGHLINPAAPAVLDFIEEVLAAGE